MAHGAGLAGRVLISQINVWQFNLTLAPRRVGRAVLGPPPLPLHACSLTPTARAEQRPTCPIIAMKGYS